MKIRHGALFLADLNPNHGTEAGKVRPVLVLQTNLLNEHQHVYRINAGVNAAAVYRSNIISRPPIERQFHTDLVKIIRDIRHSSARPAIRRKEIEHPAKTSAFETLWHIFK